MTGIVKSSICLEARNLIKTFRGADGTRVRAVDGVSLRLAHGANFGIVGESGCGKSTLARLLTRLLEPDSGEIYISPAPGSAARPVHELVGGDLRGARRKIQLIFQDSGLALDPRQRICDILAEGAGPEDRDANRWLAQVGLSADCAEKRPRALSSGERQRVAIARALAARPSILILDESTASLDASVRGGVLRLLVNLQKELGLTYLWISHDLPLVLALCDRVAILQSGRVVEETDIAAARQGKFESEHARGLFAAASFLVGRA
ncbi:MAG: ABC transporter ATP-binding protein [Planctomycetes bacterium]|nr:ABC transporter ATP-binding protein [Planctomycetota bacterium]